MNFRDIWKENKLYIITFMFIVLTITVSLASVITAKKAINEAQIIAENATLNNSIAPDQSQLENKPTITLGIRQSENLRTHGSIVTVQFETFNTDTLETCSISDGSISNEDIKSAFEDCLSTNKYRTISVGMVDNKFYIQQDTSINEESAQLVNIVTLNSKFSADDWFSLTEATYNNTYIQADSLCRYTSNGSDIRQYIYVYIAKDDPTVNGTDNKATNQSEVIGNTDQSSDTINSIKTEFPVKTPQESEDDTIANKT